MKYAEIQATVIQILQEQQGKYLLAYQIFKRIERENPTLAAQLLEAYPSEPGRPAMGKNAGIYYSAATFIAKALNHFKHSNPNIGKAFLTSEDIQNEEILAGDPKGLSIWAWTTPRTR